MPNLRHVEYFHDHQRIERMFFDGALDPVSGALRPELSGLLVPQRVRPRFRFVNPYGTLV